MANSDDKIINFSLKQDSISENDLKNLFMGLFRLVMDKAESEAKDKYTKQLYEKDEIIKKIKAENVILYQKINKKNLF